MLTNHPSRNPSRRSSKFGSCVKSWRPPDGSMFVFSTVKGSGPNLGLRLASVTAQAEHRFRGRLASEVPPHQTRVASQTHNACQDARARTCPVAAGPDWSSRSAQAERSPLIKVASELGQTRASLVARGRPRAEARVAKSTDRYPSGQAPAKVAGAPPGSVREPVASPHCVCQSGLDR